MATKNLKNGDVAVYYYHRRTNKRIKGVYGSEEFLANYLAACKTDRPADHTTTLGGLIEHYCRSDAYRSLSPHSHRNYQPILNAIIEKWSEMPLTVVDDRSVCEGILEERDRIAEKSKRQADYYVSVLSAVISHGVNIGRLTNNHAIGIKKVYKANRADKV